MAEIFDPKRHLTFSDEKRLEMIAKKHGMTLGDFIESTVKREIFVSQPILDRGKKEGVKP